MKNHKKEEHLNILIEEENTIYEMDLQCMKEREEEEEPLPVPENH